MARVYIDIEEYLSEASTEALIDELKSRDEKNEEYENYEDLLENLVDAHHCGTMTAQQVVEKLYDLLDRPYCK